MPLTSSKNSLDVIYDATNVENCERVKANLQEAAGVRAKREREGPTEQKQVGSQLNPRWRHCNERF